MGVATLRARVPGPDQARTLAVFRDLGQQLELTMVESGHSLSLQLPSGEIALKQGKSEVALTLTAANDARLYALQQVVFARLARMQDPVLPVWDHVDTGALPPTLAVTQVETVTQISPNFRRVRVVGTDLRRFAEGGLHFRLLLPRLGHAPVWPRIGADGRTEWPEGADAMHRPVYTVRAMDPGGAWLDFDVFVHEGGRVTDWTLNAAPGAWVGLMGPSGREGPDAGWVALFGDDTALPAMARMLADLPATTQGHAYILLETLEDQQVLSHPAGVTLHWMSRQTGGDLLSALRSQALPETDRFVWFAGESAQAATARALLKTDFTLLRHETSVSGYWAQPTPATPT